MQVHLAPRSVEQALQEGHHLVVSVGFLKPFLLSCNTTSFGKLGSSSFLVGFGNDEAEVQGNPK